MSRDPCVQNLVYQTASCTLSPNQRVLKKCMDNTAQDFSYCGNAQKMEQQKKAEQPIGICHAQAKVVSSQAAWIPTWKQSTTQWNGSMLAAPDPWKGYH
jgi:hypothetical protein